MTTSFHTDISVGAAANASVFNAPLGQLDAGIIATAAAAATTTAEVVAARALYASLGSRLDAMSGTAVSAEVVAARDGYPTLDDRLDAMVLGSGIVNTQANGAASAGQKVVTVDSSTGFLAGAYVGYVLAGGAIEYNSIDTVDSPTQITLDTNIGTGGIPNDGYIQLVSLAEYNGDATFNSLFVGDGTPSGYGIITLGDTIGGAVNNEGFRDETVVTAVGTGQYASFDATPSIGGTVAYDHYHAFQARPTYGSSSAVGRLASFWSEPILNGNVTNLYHLHVKDPTGAGTVTVQAGIRIEELTQGTTNYGIYQLGASMLSYFQGAIQSSGRIYTSGSMDAVSLGIGGANAGNGFVEISGTGTGARQYGLLEIFSYTGTSDPYGAYYSVSVENGKTTGGTTIFGMSAIAAMTANSADCYASVLNVGRFRATFDTASGHNLTALSVNSLQVDAPYIGAGTGTLAIGYTHGLNVANQGNAKTNTSWGIYVEDQSGSTSENYALVTNAGKVIFNAGGNAASDFTIKSDTYDALFVDASENGLALMNHASGKMSFFGAALTAKPTGVAVSAAGIHAALVTLGLIGA